MSVVVLRKSVDDERVGGPFFCAEPNERVAHLLVANETVRITADGQGKVYRDDKLVGYIVVLSAD